MRHITVLIAISLLATLTSCTTSSTTGSSSSDPVKPYTSNMCAVTDNELGSMGAPVTIIHNGQEVKFCCKPCIKKFKANPEKYLSNLQ